MRVLLPLKKLTSNKQTSNSSPVGFEEEEEEEEGYIEGIELSDFEQQQLQQEQEQFHQEEALFPEALYRSSDNNASSLEPLITLPPNKSQESGNQFPKSIHQGIEKPSLKEGRFALAELKKEVRSSPLGKRKALSTEATDFSVGNKKCPAALDTKPSARDFSTMVAGTPRSRNWLHHHNNDDRTESPEIMNTNPLENNPASARGDVPQNEEVDIDFAIALRKQGLEIKEQDGDGNCLFRAISLQVYGDPSMHGDVRKQCMNFMVSGAIPLALVAAFHFALLKSLDIPFSIVQERDMEHFAQFVTGEPFPQYIQRKQKDGVHGNNPEIQAISELFNRPVEVFTPENGATPLNIFHAEYKTADAPIRLSYHDGNHYNAVVDPLVPTAGLGLGLPGLQPGLADKLQMAKAVRESDAAADQLEFKKALKSSEDDELQRAIKESKLSAEHRSSNKAMALSDMDATYFELEQAALEQSLQSFPNFEHGKKQKASSSSSEHGKKQKASISAGVRRRKHVRNLPSHLSTAAMNTSIHSSSVSLFFTIHFTSLFITFDGFVICLTVYLFRKAVASLPENSSSDIYEARIPPPVAAAASVATAASIPEAATRDDGSNYPVVGTSIDDCPQVVQEMVMNGFELKKVVRAYGLVGDNFDDLLAFLISNTR
jgi:hypothetical protein